MHGLRGAWLRTRPLVAASVGAAAAAAVVSTCGRSAECAASPKIHLKYFAVQGAAETIRYVMAMGGLEWTEEGWPLDFSKFTGAASLHKKDGPCPGFYEAEQRGETDANLGRVPIIVVNGEHEIPQSKAIERYLAKQCGLMGGSEVEAAKIDGFVEHVRDIKARAPSLVTPAHAIARRVTPETRTRQRRPKRAAHRRCPLQEKYKAKPDKEAKAAFLATEMPLWMRKVEKAAARLSPGAGPALVGTRLSSAARHKGAQARGGVEAATTADVPRARVAAARRFAAARGSAGTRSPRTPRAPCAHLRPRRFSPAGLADAPKCLFGDVADVGWAVNQSELGTTIEAGAVTRWTFLESWTDTQAICVLPAVYGGVLKLLERTLGQVPKRLLVSKAAQIAEVIVRVANAHVEQPAVLKPALGCVQCLLAAQPEGAAPSADAAKLFRWLLEFTHHSSPKVRQRGQQASVEALSGGGAALSAAAAKFVETRLAATRAKDVQPSLFLLNFVKSALPLLQPAGAGTVVQAVVRLHTSA